MHAQSSGINWFWNYWKKMWRWREVAYTHLYARRVHKSKNLLFILYFQGTVLKCKNLLNIEKTCRKKILKISHFEVVHWNKSFHCKILLNFQETFQGILLLLLKSYFYRLILSENKFCYQWRTWPENNTLISINKWKIQNLKTI